jgi:hypothetical protein
MAACFRGVRLYKQQMFVRFMAGVVAMERAANTMRHALDDQRTAAMGLKSAARFGLQLADLSGFERKAAKSRECVALP